MDPHPAPQSVIDTLREAGALHSRQRAARLLLRGGLALVAAVPLLMLADVLGHFGGGLRLALVILYVVAALALLALALRRSWLAPPLPRVARLLEERHPALGSRLINILQLQATAAGTGCQPLTRDLARHAVKDAAAGLDLASLPPLAREPSLSRHLRYLGVALAALVLLTVFDRAITRGEWLRYLDPFGDHPPFSLTKLEIVKPAAGEKVLYGGDVTVVVRASGHHPREVFLTASPADGGGPPLTLPLADRGDGSFAGRLVHLTRPLDLTAHTANMGSRSYRHRLDLILTPQWGPAVVRVEPPSYTGLPPRESPYRFTAMQVLEGTKLAFDLTSNRPLAGGSITLDTGGDSPLDFPLAPPPEGPAGTVRASLTASTSGRLAFAPADALGNPPDESRAATLTVTRDQPPAIAISAPDGDALVVENLTIPVTVDAGDDFGLRAVRLHLALNDQPIPVEPVAFDQPNQRAHRLEHALDLAAIGAKAGDTVVIFAEAVDTRPDPQVGRTRTVRLAVITEDDYNDRLRERADVALIAGKYEELLDRLDQAVAEQRRIEDSLAALRERAATQPDAARDLEEFSEHFAAQHHLNERLEQLAEEMDDFGREHPLYDFERGLHEALREQAAAIRGSVERNRADGETALEKSERPPAAPGQETLRDMANAAREQRERLQGGSDQARQEITEPLEDLANLHELMKDFNRFEELAKEQRELADQANAYKDKQELSAEDRAALRDLAARQREQAGKLEQLARKLKADAEAAKDAFPEAAASAEQLADAIEDAAMGNLARDAARKMHEGDGDQAHAGARKLQEEMDALCQECAGQGMAGMPGAMDRALAPNKHARPGDALRQMLLSRLFRGQGGQGQAGMAGMGGFMGGMTGDGEAQLLGGESLMEGSIAQAVSGRGRGDGGGPGTDGGPAARLDPARPGAVDQQSARRTNAPDGSTLLMQYERIADAYFHQLTTSGRDEPPE